MGLLKPLTSYWCRRFFVIINVDKPFKTIDEQIALLKQRGLRINDEEYARKVLKEVPYYSLINGYKTLFLVSKSDDRFSELASFELFYYVYILDINLNNIILKYLLMVEKSFKAKIAYTVAKNFGELNQNYLAVENYSNRNNKRNDIVNQLKEAISKCRFYTPTYHYKQKKGYVPPWILTNDIMFGLARQWYNILPSNQKEEIANEIINSNLTDLTIQEKQKFLSDSTKILNDFRNDVAHGTRTFNFSCRDREIAYNFYRKALNTVSKEEYRSLGLGKNDLFSVLFSITLLLNEPTVKEMWIFELKGYSNRFMDGKKIMDKDVHTIFNLPNDFIERLQKNWLFYAQILSLGYI